MEQHKTYIQFGQIILVTILLQFLIIPINAQAYSEFDIDIETYARALNLPAMAIGVSKGDSVIFFRGIGTASPGKKEPITKDHIFTIASVTKTFTSLLLQQLESEGELSVNDKIDAFPNKFFNANRWDSSTTLAHVISHTSESIPHGSNFAYNGSKFNLVYNAFAKLYPPAESEGVTRPFTRALEDRILIPLGMDHTLVRYDPKEHSFLDPMIVVPYEYNDTIHEYTPKPIVLENIECGPAYGMMSSFHDLVTYSNALSDGRLIASQRFANITKPYYTGSPQGMGWFTRKIDGIDLYWAYGYGFNDAAILLKVPKLKLTLIMLAATTVPSMAAPLEFGNPLNNPLVDSFLRNFVLHIQRIIPLRHNLDGMSTNFKESHRKIEMEIFLEEVIAWTSLYILSPTSDKDTRAMGIGMMKWLSKNFPKAEIWNSTTATELLAVSDDELLMQFGVRACTRQGGLKYWHPSKLYYYGLLEEKLRHQNKAVKLYKKLADNAAYSEQQPKFDAMMKLAEYYIDKAPEKSKEYLRRLIKYKENIGVMDTQYRKAKSWYESF